MMIDRLFCFTYRVSHPSGIMKDLFFVIINDNIYNQVNKTINTNLRTTFPCQITCLHITDY